MAVDFFKKYQFGRLLFRYWGITDIGIAQKW